MRRAYLYTDHAFSIHFYRCSDTDTHVSGDFTNLEVTHTE